MPTFESPPANAVKKNSGKMIEGSRNAGLVVKLWICRQATACVTSSVPAHVRTSRLRSANEAPVMASSAIAAAIPKPSASASPSQPVITNERTPSSR